MSSRVTGKDAAIARAEGQSSPRKPTWLAGFAQSFAPTPQMSMRRGLASDRPALHEHEDDAVPTADNITDRDRTG